MRALVSGIFLFIFELWEQFDTSSIIYVTGIDQCEPIKTKEVCTE